MKPMKAKATVRLPLESERKLAALIKALTPEVSQKIGERSQATIIQDQQFIVLNVEAEDIVALRSALNAYLRWINSTLSVMDVVGKNS
jgi:tRNA threonylcarbamoyladenosine modification (KEOPS) complex  Pcc1 subunit